MEYQDVMKHRWAAILFLCVCSQFTGYCYLGSKRLKFEPNLGTALFSAVIGYLTARSVLDPGCPNSLYKALCFFFQSILSLVFNNFALALLWIPMVKAGVKFCGLLSEIKLLPSTPYWMRTVFCLMALGSAGIAMYNTIFRHIIHFCVRFGNNRCPPRLKPMSLQYSRLNFGRRREINPHYHFIRSQMTTGVHQNNGL